MSKLPCKIRPEKYKAYSCSNRELKNGTRNVKRLYSEWNGHTSKTEKTRTKCRIEYLIVYLHIIAFKKFILERASKTIESVHTYYKKQTIIYISKNIKLTKIIHYK